MQAGIDRHAPNVEHVEVATTHLGLGLSPVVFRIIAAPLARGPLAGRGIAGQEIAKPLGDFFPSDDPLLHQHRQ